MNMGGPAAPLTAATVAASCPATMPLSAILDATAPVSPGRPRTDTISQDPAVRRRYRSIYNEIERAELNAMVAVLKLVSRNMAERAEREGTLAAAVG